MGRLRAPAKLANYKYCKQCGSRLTLDVHTGEGIAKHHDDEKLLCPVCLKESTYSSDDFKTAVVDRSQRTELQTDPLPRFAIGLSVRQRMYFTRNSLSASDGVYLTVSLIWSAAEGLSLPSNAILSTASTISGS
jgi:hypothetical protein